MIPLLIAYFLDSVCFYYLCGLVGRTYHPLASYQIYALGCLLALIPALFIGRKLKIWNWRRVWPPTKSESLASLASTIILTSATLAFLSKSSLTSNIAMKAGCLLLVAKGSPVISGLAVVAVILSALNKPLTAAFWPLVYASAYVFGYWLKLKATKSGQRTDVADFLATEQLFVCILALGVASIFSHQAPSAPLSDWRLWAISATSLGAGLFGTAIMLQSKPSSVTFPIYRCASLLAALMASFAHGEPLGLSGWVAVALAVLVVFSATGKAWVKSALVGWGVWLKVATGKNQSALAHLL